MRYYYKLKSNPKSTLNLKEPLTVEEFADIIDDYEEITEEEYNEIIESLEKGEQDYE